MTLTVLHAIHGFGGGGAERQLSYLAPALCDLGVDVHIAHVSEGPNYRRVLESGCNLHPMPAVGNFDPRLLMRIRGIIRNVNPSVVQTWLPQMDIIAGIGALVCRKPYVVSERNSALAYSSGWKGPLRVAVARRARTIVANSAAGAAFWTSELVAPDCRVIGNGIPVHELTRIRDASSLEKIGPVDKKLVLYAGRFVPAKNIMLIAESLKYLVENDASFNAALFGNGPLESSVRRLAFDARLSHRIRVRPYTRSLWNWMGRASALISLSKNEGQPNVVLEAAAIGCPLILSDIREHRDLFDDESALFIDTDNPSKIADLVKDYLFETAVVRSRAAAARSRVEGSFDFRDRALEYMKLYEEIASGQDA